MVRQIAFIFAAILATAGCAANVQPPVVAEPPPAAPATQETQKKLIEMGSIPLDDVHRLLVSEPEGWRFSIPDPQVAQRDGFPGPCGIIQNDDLGSFVAVFALDSAEKTADEEARSLRLQMMNEPGIPAGMVTTGSVIPFADDAGGATFDFSAGEAVGFITVRHLGKNHDVHVGFIGHWPRKHSPKAVEVYWKTVLGTNVW